MTARVGRGAWRAVCIAGRTVIRAVKTANDEQVRMWECVLVTSRAAPVTTAGPLRWVNSLDGHRLVGSYLTVEDLAGRCPSPHYRPDGRYVYDPAHEHAGAGTAAAWA